ncbi:MAG: hypothetical protein ACTS85_01245 [Arsenophonus sp. NC-PG7-MAG3]
MALTEAENTLILSGKKVYVFGLPSQYYRQWGNAALKSDVEEQNDLAIRKQRYNSSDINKSVKD